MKKPILILFFIALQYTSKAVTLSDSLEISVLTVSPGTELYSTFGHTAVRVRDLINKHDLVFNYGTFDFETSNFYLKFALGKLDYLLSVESFEGFVSGCESENRSVFEQKLILSDKQCKDIINLLIENLQPENRAYRYKFFTDNCSTRIRDLLVRAIADSSLFQRSNNASNNSFRYLFTQYLTTMPWSRFGIELLLGKMTDNKSGYDAMFLPDVLKESIKNASANGSLLAEKETTIYINKNFDQKQAWFSPIFFSILLIIIALSVSLNKTMSLIFDNALFFVIGLLGLFIIILSIFSLHSELHYNFVIFFLPPTHIIFPFLNRKNKRNYSSIIFLVTVLGLFALPVIPQNFNSAFLLLIASLLIRIFYNSSHGFWLRRE
jgi:hypothetical protein